MLRRAPRRPLLAAVAASLVLIMIPVHATADDAGRSPYPDTASKWGGLGSEDPVLRSDENTFTGYDGATYSRAGWTVKGRRGAVYLGEEFDSACLTGDRFGQALGRLAQFARVIRASGRTVIFTVAPSKSAVYKKDLPTSMPHGSCDAQGIAAQDRVLDTFSDPSYIPLRKQMATMMDRGTPAYWRLDSHWTTVGSTRWGQRVARRLDPDIARIQRYRMTKRTHVPDIAYVIGQTGVKETEKARVTTTKVRTVAAAGSPGYHYENLTGFDIAWSTLPATKVWPGRTLLLGDSFTYLGMESLIPLFRHGRFMWTGHVELDDLVQAVTESDTVVIEVAQRYVANSSLADATTHLRLALDLAVADLGS